VHDPRSFITAVFPRLPSKGPATAVFTQKGVQTIMSNPPDSALFRQTRSLLSKYKVRARKPLGQHFLIDEAILDRIASAADLTNEDTVIEVGPGLGTLTSVLASKAGHVTAVELDGSLALLLKERLSRFTNLTILNQDILGVNPAEVIDVRFNRGYKVVANLPYYITSPVLRHFLEASAKPELMVVMVQKEVGEAIASKDKLSLLSIGVQFYARPEIVTIVPASSFYPAPKVDSVVLRLDVLPKPAVEVSNVETFFNTVRCGFGSPRKQLRNSLATGMGIEPSRSAGLLELAGMDARLRPEDLKLEDWRRIWETIERQEDIRDKCAGPRKTEPGA
jgi:16S rRNA (adenine1518-N6/adenine1519-N6)-dimethyltransferase